MSLLETSKSVSSLILLFDCCSRPVDPAAFSASADREDNKSCFCGPLDQINLKKKPLCLSPSLGACVVLITVLSMNACRLFLPDIYCRQDIYVCVCFITIIIVVVVSEYSTVPTDALY